LHRTEREGLEEVAREVGLPPRRSSALPTDELWDVLRELAERQDLEWMLQAVEVPTQPQEG
jgi:hypothetical protein